MELLDEDSVSPGRKDIFARVEAAAEEMEESEGNPPEMIAAIARARGKVPPLPVPAPEEVVTHVEPLTVEVPVTTLPLPQGTQVTVPYEMIARYRAAKAEFEQAQQEVLAWLATV